jgi:hypothetical protein
MKADVILSLITFGLVLAGCWLYVFDLVGWAQMLWIFASGTAGGAVVLMTEHWDD